jgi:hypothetical protein
VDHREVKEGDFSLRMAFLFILRCIMSTITFSSNQTPAQINKALKALDKAQEVVRKDVTLANKKARGSVTPLTHANGQTPKYVQELLEGMSDKQRAGILARDVVLQPGMMKLTGYEDVHKSSWIMGLCVVMASLLQAGHINVEHIEERIETQILKNMRPMPTKRWAIAIKDLLVKGGFLEAGMSDVTVRDRDTNTISTIQSQLMDAGKRAVYNKDFKDAMERQPTANRLWEAPLERDSKGKVTAKGFVNGGSNKLVKGFKGEVKQLFVDIANHMQSQPMYVSERAVEIAQIMADTAFKGAPKEEDFLYEVNGDIRTDTNAWDEAKRKHKAYTDTVTTLAELKPNVDMYSLAKYDAYGRLYMVSGQVSSQGTAAEKFAMHLHTDARHSERTWFLLLAFTARAFGQIIKSGHEEYTWKEQAEWTLNFMKTPEFLNLKSWKGVHSLAKKYPRSEPLEAVACVEEIWKVQKALKEGNPLGSVKVTGSVFYVDGKTNVLEHVAALMRDMQSAKLANILKQERPVDAYTVVLRSVRYDGMHPMIAKLLRKATRDIAKQPVMLTIYGGSLNTIVREIVRKVSKLMDKEGIQGDALVISELVTNALVDALYTAYPAVMNMTARIKKAAVSALEDGMEKWEWESDLGFKIVDVKLDREWSVVRTVSETFNMGWECPLDRRGMVTRLSPNFIHVMDAEHAQRIILRCKELKIPMLPIFDAFGTTLDKLDRLLDVIHETFGDMYDKPNMSLNNLLKMLGSRPWMGDDEIPAGAIREANCVFN